MKKKVYLDMKQKIFKLSSSNNASSDNSDPIAEMRYNYLYGELLIKFKSSEKIYKYEVPEIVEQQIRTLRRKKNYSKVIKMLNALGKKQHN